MDNIAELYNMDSILADRKLDVKRSQLLLYFFHPAKGVIEGRTKLEKMVYLAQREGVPFGYKFDKFFYGPSDDAFLWNITLLKNSGTIIEKQIYKGESEAFWSHKYVLTPLGELAIKKINIEKEYQQIIDNIVLTWKGKSKSELISYVGELWFSENKIDYS